MQWGILGLASSILYCRKSSHIVSHRNFKPTLVINTRKLHTPPPAIAYCHYFTLVFASWSRICLFLIYTLLSQVSSSQTPIHALFVSIPSAFSCPSASLSPFSNQAQHCFSSFYLSTLVLNILYKKYLVWCSNCIIAYRGQVLHYNEGLFNHNESKILPLLGASKLALEDTNP